MTKRTYITQDELDRILSYLKLNKIWNYYLIIHNLVLSGKSYKDLKLTDLNIPSGIPIPETNPFSISIRAVNKQLKNYQSKIGLRDVNLTTKIFSRKFTVRGEIFYGMINKQKISYIKGDESYIYILKHKHRNPEISKMFTDKKIGISHDYIKRIENLTLGTIGYEVLRTWKTSSKLVKFLEKNIHYELSDLKLVGEWFSDENNILIERVEKIISSYNLIETH
jgi:hypothetical protein